jgi:hypothetical protein
MLLQFIEYEGELFIPDNVLRQLTRAAQLKNISKLERRYHTHRSLMAQTIDAVTTDSWQQLLNQLCCPRHPTAVS